MLSPDWRDIVLLIPFFVVVNSDMQRRMRQVIKEAAVRAYGSIGAACIDMGVAQPHFNRALDGERGLPAGFLNLSPGFYGWLAVGLVEEFGIPKAVRRSALLMLGVMARRRILPARMTGQKEVA
jgi:hypothetical protein